jgi:hypothetical protein
MKNFIIGSIFCVFVTFSLHAQVDNLPWSPPGATWVYRISAQFNEVYAKMVYVKDTIFLSKNVKKMSISKFQIFGPNRVRVNEAFMFNTYMYVSQDSVFWYNNNEFQLVYIFSAQVGQSWVIKKQSGQNCTNTVPDSESVSVNSVAELTTVGRRFSISRLGNSNLYWRLGEGIIKNIGSLGALFPVPGRECIPRPNNSPVTEVLECYQDSLRGVVKFYSVRDCPSLLTRTRDLPRKFASSVVIFPNPAFDQITIKNDANIDIRAIRILDLLGREYLHIKSYTGQSIDVSDMPGAVYLIQFISSDNAIYSTKMIKIQ